MTTYTVEAPDGKTITIEGPPGASHEEVIAQAQKLYQPSETRRKSPLQAIGEKAGEIGSAMVAPIKRDIQEDLAAQGKTQGFAKDMVQTFAHPFEAGGALRSLKEVGDIIGGATYPINEPIHRGSEAIKKATGGLVDIEPALAALPAEGGALKIASAAREAEGLAVSARGANTLKEAAAAETKAAEKAAKPKGKLADVIKPPPGPKGGPDVLQVTNSETAKHAESAAILRKEGVDLTSGQAAGGASRRLEETSKSVPVLGQAIREREQNALETFNMATYNQVLKPLGVRLKKGPVGREGVDLVGKVIGDRYDRIMPKLVMKADKELAEDVSEIKNRLLPSQQAEFTQFIKNRVVDRMKDGTMTGRDFKSAESELSNIARNLSGSADGAQKMMGQAFHDALGAMRDNLERHSSPEVRDELRRINTAWAGYARLDSAAANRTTSFGKFTTGDLLAAVKKEDKSRRKGAFARGDAMLTEWADHGHRVLRNVVPDSGTPERLASNGWLGLPHAAMSALGEGRATDAITPLAKNLLAAHARSRPLMRGEKAVSPTGPNMLARSTNAGGQYLRPSVRALAAAAAAKALQEQSQGSNQPQQ